MAKVNTAKEALKRDREREATLSFIYEALRFALWAAGEGICPAPGELATAPEDFLFEYTNAIDGDDWDGVPESITSLLRESLKTIAQNRTCATCHAVLADGPQPAATYGRPISADTLANFLWTTGLKERASAELARDLLANFKVSALSSQERNTP
ncbi:hypothetical protein GWE18_00185 [Bradyrhizobium sp. CSA112]|uniref:hypothetical protein n=1 Tax=Bradyrhizobium sp. CSA112 TaxID=2699170 RepID=UPI0023B0A78C|nr:hypothetical protein [Bradyrhizobium sp. CSA112]MDE5451294.1 hypothetical protein [Bradyrhizobium sp. CSA112]